MVWKDLKHQLRSSTAAGGFHILNFHLRLLQACSQGLNTVKNVKPPGLLRPECLRRGHLQPFQIQQASASIALFGACGFFPFARRTSASFLSSDIDWLICSPLFLGNAYVRCQGPKHGQLPPTLLRVTWQSHFHDYLRIQDNLVLKKRLG